MTTEELIEGFSLDRVSKSPAVFDEQKLRWMNGRYLRELAPERLTEILEERHGRSGLGEAVGIAQEKMQTLDDFWTLAAFLVERQDFDEKAWAKVMGDGAAGAPGRGARGAGGGRAVRHRVGGGRPARRGGAAGSQAEGGLPAGEGGDQRYDCVAGHLRVRRRAGTRGDAFAHRSRAWSAPGLNCPRPSADTQSGFSSGSCHDRTHGAIRYMGTAPKRRARTQADSGFRRAGGVSRRSPSRVIACFRSCATTTPAPGTSWLPSNRTARWSSPSCAWPTAWAAASGARSPASPRRSRR